MNNELAILRETVKAISRMPDRPEVVPIDEPVRRHAFVKGYESAMQDVRARIHIEHKTDN
jgi:hypothetical protein